MDLSHLSAAFDAHKAPILAAAGAGVVGLALYRKKTTAAAKPATGTTGIAASAGGQTAATTGAAAYDSSASDLYGAIQPQLESLGGQLTDLRNQLNGTPPVPVPAATPNPTPAAGSSSSSSSGVKVGVPAGETPTPVPAAKQSWQQTYSSPAATTNYLTGQINGAGGSATWTATPGGAYTGRIDSTGSSSASQLYTPVAAGLNGQQALMSTSALPQTGSLGPVGTVYVDTDGHTKKVTGYTFNGMPSQSWLN